MYIFIINKIFYSSIYPGRVSLVTYYRFMWNKIRYYFQNGFIEKTKHFRLYLGY